MTCATSELWASNLADKLCHWWNCFRFVQIAGFKIQVPFDHYHGLDMVTILENNLKCFFFYFKLKILVFLDCFNKVILKINLIYIFKKKKYLLSQQQM